MKCSPLPGHARPLENSHDDPARVEKQKETSYLAHIDVLPGCDPIALFLEWKALAAARGALMTNTMVISTVNSVVRFKCSDSSRPRAGGRGGTLEDTGATPHGRRCLCFHDGLPKPQGRRSVCGCVYLSSDSPGIYVTN
ncbi:Protein of unknown function [Gryllus bimaculatus]|nr:Protein of unknown function [Gryllus bimaculatus]